MQVLKLEERDRQDWDAYVNASPQATVYHLAAWKDVMEDALGLRTNYLFARNGSHVAGVLPLLYVRSRLSGPYFTSMPSGVCAENDDAAHALIQCAMQLVGDSAAKYLVLRDSFRRWDVPGLVTDESHCTLITNLNEGPQAMWTKLDRRVRQHVRKAESGELEVLMGPQYLDELYPAYSEAMRDLGTPTLGLGFFRQLLSRFPVNFTTVMVRAQDQVLGGAFVAKFRDTLYNTWGGMRRASFPLRSSHLWYWETLKYGQESGYRHIDLGRSEWDSGTFEFKKHWLSEPRPLYHQFYLNGPAKAPAIGSRRCQDLTYRFFVKGWQLMPLPMTERVGPFLRQRMPFG